MTQINYFISENYIPHWTLEDAYRELHQNFKDYGVYDIDKINLDPETDSIELSNTFNPESADLLIIGESNKTDKQIGKYGEGLKMAALVLLRNGYTCFIFTKTFIAEFILITNENTTVRTLGVNIREPREEQESSFIINITAPINTFDIYTQSIIKAEDVIHTREGYGSIVSKPKGNIYVGDLFVCNIKKLNYAYNLSPKQISLDRDRKVPKDWDINYNVSRVQETYEEFDKVGKSADVIYSNIPDNFVQSYTPKASGDRIIFTTKVKNDKGEEEEVQVSDSFTSQLVQHSYFSKIIFKIKQLITSSLGIDELALKFRTNYCHSDLAEKDFNILMYRLGIVLPDVDIDSDKLPF